MESFFIQTERQKEILEKIQRYIPIFQERERSSEQLGSFSFDNVNDLKKIGYTKLPLEDLSTYELVLFQENIARGDGSTALGIGWHVSTLLDLQRDNKWPKEIYHNLCERVKEGALINYVLSERGKGSPTRGGRLSTKAHRVKDGWEISGRKSFASMALVLDYFIVSVQVEEENEESLFLIPSRTEGVRIDEVWDSVALRGTASHDIVLDRVTVPDSYLVDKKPIAALENSTGGFLHIPACYLGIAQAARDYALTFASNYKPNSLNRPIRTAPHIQMKIGQMELQLAQARHLLYSVAKTYDEWEHKQSLNSHLAATKYTVTNHAITIVDLAMRIVGARSLSEKNPLQKYYVNVRAGLHNPPADDEILSFLAEKAQIEDVKEPAKV
ncbi:MAG TPA: acyl-CoA dehydrogenase [Bacillota bacterium]